MEFETPDVLSHCATAWHHLILIVEITMKVKKFEINISIPERGSFLVRGQASGDVMRPADPGTSIALHKADPLNGAM